MNVGAFVAHSFNHWKNAIDRFKSHSENLYHKICSLAAETFISVARGERKNIL